MGKEKLETLVEERGLEEAVGFERLAVMAPLLARLAAGGELGAELEEIVREVFENRELLTEKFHEEPWILINKYLQELARLDPERSLELAAEWCLLPKAEDDQQELVNGWMRSNGLTMLGQQEISPMVGEYLSNGERRSELTYYLIAQIHTNIVEFDKRSKFTHPQGFNTLQAVFVGTQITPINDLVRRGMEVTASVRMKDGDIQQAAKIAMGWAGCEQFKSLVIE